MITKVSILLITTPKFCVTERYRRILVKRNNDKLFWKISCSATILVKRNIEITYSRQIVYLAMLKLNTASILLFSNILSIEKLYPLLGRTNPIWQALVLMLTSSCQNLNFSTNCSDIIVVPSIFLSLVF